MQTNLQNVIGRKTLLFVLGFIGLAIIFANFFGEEFAGVVADVGYISSAAVIVILSSVICSRYKVTGHHAKAWLFFLAFSLSWMAADYTWIIYERVLYIDPYPSLADFFYLIGYPFLFMFSVLYILPVKKALNSKIIISAIAISVIVTLPTLEVTFMSEEFDSDSDFLEVILATSYVLADSIVLVPAILGIVLFFRGEVNFLWTLIFFGIISTVIADSVYVTSQFDDSYYTGHPIDVLFIWTYVLFSFGIYSHLKIFKSKTRSDKDRLEN